MKKKKLIELPPEDARSLDYLSKKEHRSQVSIVREAVHHYLVTKNAQGLSRPGFALWKKKNLDSLEYQRKLRSEWD
jgi:hypothetical protein